MAFTKVLGPGIHTLSNITSHNIHSSGIITATGFDGPFTNLNVTGVTTFSGDVSIGGTLTYEDVKNIDSIGIVTATRFDGPFTNLNVTGVTTFAGDVSIGGTLTYEDVTNIDSVGVITAREAIDLPTNKKILLGDNDKFEIYKSSTHAVINNKYGGGSWLTLGSGNGVILQSSVGTGQELFRATVNGDNKLYYANSLKFQTTSTGAKVTGTLKGASEVGIQSGGVQIGAGITQLNFVGTGNTFAVNGTTVDISIQGGGGGGSGAFTTSITGIQTTSQIVGIGTTSTDDPDLQGIGNSAKGMYVSNGMIIMDNAVSGNHYIGTNFNALMVGPVNISGTISIDGNYVVV